MTKLFFKELLKHAIDTYSAELKNKNLLAPLAEKEALNEAYRATLDKCCSEADELVEKIATIKL